MSFKRHKYGYTNTRLHEIKQYKNIDILFVGSSHTYRSFDSRNFEKMGLKVFVLGTSAQTPTQTEVLLRRYIDRINPKLVVLEVYPVMFAIDGVESALDIIANDENDINSIYMSLTQNNILVYNSLIYAFYRNLIDKTTICNEDWRFLGDTYIPRGFVEKKLSFYKGGETFPDVSLQLLNKHKRAFERTVKYLNDKGVKYIIIQTPITKNLYKHIKTTDFFDSTMTCYGEYCNFNQNSKLDDSLHFYDAEHLNTNGAKIFNKVFFNYLQKINFIK